MGNNNIYTASFDHVLERAWSAAMASCGGYRKIKQSPQDDRSYRFFQLENELKVVVVSDPVTEKAAGALCVHVGECCL